MTIAGFTGWVGDQFDIAWAGGVGAAQGLAAAVDGFIPYFDPFEQTYASTDGTIDGNAGFFTRNFTGFDVSTPRCLRWVRKSLNSAQLVHACGA